MKYILIDWSINQMFAKTVNFQCSNSGAGNRFSLYKVIFGIYRTRSRFWTHSKYSLMMTWWEEKRKEHRKQAATKAEEDTAQVSEQSIIVVKPKCDVCGTIYNSEEELNAHSKSDHKTLPSPEKERSISSCISNSLALHCMYCRGMRSLFSCPKCITSSYWLWCVHSDSCESQMWKD